MSYCRLGPDSDLYVFESYRGFECCWCALLPPWRDSIPEIRHTVTDTTEEMIDHVRLHIAVGHDVPEHLIPALVAGDG